MSNYTDNKIGTTVKQAIDGFLTNSVVATFTKVYNGIVEE